MTPRWSVRKTYYREWTIYWGQYGNARFWSDIVPPSHKGHLYPLSHVGSFTTREEAVAKALELIDEETGGKVGHNWYAQKAQELISRPIRCRQLGHDLPESRGIFGSH